MLGRPAAGVASRCNLLRRRPRKRVDPGLVADSDVVSRTKTEEGRKPEAGSSSRSVPEAPGGLSAEPRSRPPSSPPRRLLSGRVSVSSLVHLPLTPFFFWRGGPQALADCGGCGREGLLLGLGGSPAGLATASGEPRCCRAPSPGDVRGRVCYLAFSAGNRSRGLAGKSTVAPAGFIFRARQLTRVEAYNGVKEESRYVAGRRNPQILKFTLSRLPLFWSPCGV